MQVEHNTASLPSMIAPFNKGLATAMSRIEDLEVTRLRASDAVLPSDLEKMLARCGKAPTHDLSVSVVDTLAMELCMCCLLTMMRRWEGQAWSGQSQAHSC